MHIISFAQVDAPSTGILCNQSGERNCYWIGIRSEFHDLPVIRASFPELFNVLGQKCLC